MPPNVGSGLLHGATEEEAAFAAGATPLRPVPTGSVRFWIDAPGGRLADRLAMAGTGQEMIAADKPHDPMAMLNMGMAMGRAKSARTAFRMIICGGRETQGMPADEAFRIVAGLALNPNIGSAAIDAVVRTDSGHGHMEAVGMLRRALAEGRGARQWIMD